MGKENSGKNKSPSCILNIENFSIIVHLTSYVWFCLMHPKNNQGFGHVASTQIPAEMHKNEYFTKPPDSRNVRPFEGQVSPTKKPTYQDSISGFTSLVFHPGFIWEVDVEHLGCKIEVFQSLDLRKLRLFPETSNYLGSMYGSYGYYTV